MLDRVALPRKIRSAVSGVLLDPVLLLDKQVAALARSAFYQLQLVWKL